MGETAPRDNVAESEAPKTPEQREAEGTRRTFEFRDAKGNLLGSAEVELGDLTEVDRNDEETGLAGKAREVTSLILTGVRDGSPKSVDLLALANPHGVRVLMAESRLQNYSYNNSERKALVPQLQSLTDIGVALHELGHADQYARGRVDAISEISGDWRKNRHPDYGQVREAIALVEKAVPQAEGLVEDARLKELDGLEKQKIALFERMGDEESASSAAERAAWKARKKLGRHIVDEKIVPELLAPSGDVIETNEPPDLVLERAGFVLDESEAASEVEADSFNFGADVKKKYFPRSGVTGDSLKKMAEYVSDADYIGRTELAFDAATKEFTISFTQSLPERSYDIEVRGKIPEGAADLLEIAVKAGADAAAAKTALARTRAHIDGLRAEQQKIMSQTMNLEALRALPTRMMERDATRWALQKARELREKANIDIFAPVVVKKRKFLHKGEASESCEEATAEGVANEGSGQTIETTMLADLQRALKSYGADTRQFRLRRPGEPDDIGIMPGTGNIDTPKE